MANDCISLPAFDTLHDFPRLPQELRIKIWKLHHAAAEPRTITVRSYGPGDANARWFFYFFSADPTPATLHACQESRREARSVYSKAFATAYGWRYIWTDYDRDTIKIEASDLVNVDRATQFRLRQVFIEVSEPNGDLLFWSGGYPRRIIFATMPMLRSLTISGSSLMDWDEDIIGRLTARFESYFGSLPGYVCPEIKLLQMGTGSEINAENYSAILAADRERDLELGRESRELHEFMHSSGWSRSPREFIGVWLVAEDEDERYV